MPPRRVIYLLVLALAACGTHAMRYPVPTPVGTIVNDAPAFDRFARAVRPALVRERRWFVLAMLDALADRWPAAIANLDRAAALETTPAAKAMLGLSLRVFADGGDVRAALQARVAALPRAELRDALSMLRTMAQQFSPTVCAQLVTDEVGPHVANGTVGIADAHAIVFQRYAVVFLVPAGHVIDEVLAGFDIPPVQ